MNLRLPTNDYRAIIITEHRMSDHKNNVTRSIGRAIRICFALFAFVALGALLIGVVEVGWLASLSLTSGAVIAYHVPALLFDWPRLQWDDLVGVIEAIFDAVGSCLSALFDW